MVSRAVVAFGMRCPRSCKLLSSARLCNVLSVDSMRTWEGMQTKERIVDLGVKIFYALFKKVPESLKLFPFRDNEGKPVLAELRKHGLKTFVAFGDVIDGLDNADKTSQIFEHLVRCALVSCAQLLLLWAGHLHDSVRGEPLTQRTLAVP
jgi:hypothetical protein